MGEGGICFGRQCPKYLGPNPVDLGMCVAEVGYEEPRAGERGGRGGGQPR